MTRTEALMKVAQAWCQPTTSSREMDSALAEAFADILLREIPSTDSPCDCDEPRRCTCGGKFTVDEDGLCACCGMDVTWELLRYQEGYDRGVEEAAVILDETSRDAARASIREHAKKAAAAIRSLKVAP